jgi:hypothetical protein
LGGTGWQIRHNDRIDKRIGDAVISVTARDHFAGRSPVRFGVGEFIDLSVLSADVTPPAGLRWFIESDASGGTLINNTATNDGTALYTAGHTAGAVTLVVKVLSGPKAGPTVAKTTITVVTPTDAVMVQEPGTTSCTNTATGRLGSSAESSSARPMCPSKTSPGRRAPSALWQPAT